MFGRAGLTEQWHRATNPVVLRIQAPDRLQVIRERGKPMDIVAHNKAAWDRKVQEGNRWTLPISKDAIGRARSGQFELLLTPTKPVPMAWFPELQGTPTLCLAAGGGQQAPLLAAAGARVTVFDNSPKQLAQDRLVSEREGLTIETVEGDMANLSKFADGQFQLIVHPVSNCFVPNVLPVWRECFRVLQPGGILLAGFDNPVRWLFEDGQPKSGRLEVCRSVPWSGLAHVNASGLLEQMVKDGVPLEFGHTLADQIGGQLEAGFVLTGLYEDRYDPPDEDPISRYIDTFIATRAIKLDL